MQVALKIVYVLYSPILAVLYWRNSMRRLELDWDSTPHQNQSIDLEMAQV